MNQWLARVFVLPLLDTANDSPPLFGRREFYALKTRLLRRWATPDGVDIQHTKHECWNCNGAGCYRCTGGIYRESVVRLDRWRWGRHSFHTFGGVVDDRAAAPITIHGFVRHEKRHRIPHITTEAWYWLALVFDRRTLWHTFGHSYHYRARTPLVLLGNLVSLWRQGLRRFARWRERDELPF